MNDKMLENLRELIEQWEQTARLFRLDMSSESLATANAYLDCVTELRQILEGDLSPIAKW